MKRIKQKVHNWWSTDAGKQPKRLCVFLMFLHSNSVKSVLCIETLPTGLWEVSEWGLGRTLRVKGLALEPTLEADLNPDLQSPAHFSTTKSPLPRGQRAGDQSPLLAIKAIQYFEPRPVRFSFSLYLAVLFWLITWWVIPKLHPYNCCSLAGSSLFAWLNLKAYHWQK